MLNHIGTQIIDTDRLLLRRYEVTDAEDMFQNWVTDSEVSRFGGWKPHQNIDETNALLASWIGEYQKIDIYHWVIILKDIAQAIGYIYLNKLDNANDSASIHYALSRNYWNKGLTTEACKGVLDFAFSKLHVKRIHTCHHIDNPASGRVQQKCNMRYIKTSYRHVPADEQLNGEYCYYEITANDWKRLF